MKERGIPFQPDMVCAILRDVDPKTQTRRLVKIQPSIVDEGFKYQENCWTFWHDEHYPLGRRMECPYGQPGDRLWVREAWRLGKGYDGLPGSKVGMRGPGIKIHYEADGKAPAWAGRYRHARFMPRWASRITLEITEVRVQRLQDISEPDAKAEGAPVADYGEACTIPQSFIGCVPFVSQSHHYGFQALWQSINADRTPWANNPYVWAIGFKRITP